MQINDHNKVFQFPLTYLSANKAKPKKVKLPNWTAKIHLCTTSDEIKMLLNHILTFFAKEFPGLGGTLFIFTRLCHIVPIWVFIHDSQHSNTLNHVWKWMVASYAWHEVDTGRSSFQSNCFSFANNAAALWPRYGSYAFPCIAKHFFQVAFLKE